MTPEKTPKNYKLYVQHWTFAAFCDVKPFTANKHPNVVRINAITRMVYLFTVYSFHV